MLPAWCPTQHNLLALGSQRVSFDASLHTSASLDIAQLDLTTGTPQLITVGRQPLKDAVSALSWGSLGPSKGSILATGHENGAINFYNPDYILSPQQSSTPLISTQTHHNEKITALQFHPKMSHLLASGSYDSETFLYDLTNQASIKVARPNTTKPGTPAPRGASVTCLQWSDFIPKFLTTGHQTGTTQIFDLSEKRPLVSFQNYSRINSEVTDVQWGSGVELAISYSGSNSIEIYDFRNQKKPLLILDIPSYGQPLSPHQQHIPHGVSSMRWDTTTRTLLAADTHGFVHHFDMSNPAHIFSPLTTPIRPPIEGVGMSLLYSYTPSLLQSTPPPPDAQVPSTNIRLHPRFDYYAVSCDQQVLIRPVPVKADHFLTTEQQHKILERAVVQTPTHPTSPKSPNAPTNTPGMCTVSTQPGCTIGFGAVKFTWGREKEYSFPAADVQIQTILQSIQKGLWVGNISNNNMKSSETSSDGHPILPTSTALPCNIHNVLNEIQQMIQNSPNSPQLDMQLLEMLAKTQPQFNLQLQQQPDDFTLFQQVVSLLGFGLPQELFAWQHDEEQYKQQQLQSQQQAENDPSSLYPTQDANQHSSATNFNFSLNPDESYSVYDQQSPLELNNQQPQLQKSENDAKTQEHTRPKRPLLNLLHLICGGHSATALEQIRNQPHTASSSLDIIFLSLLRDVLNGLISTTDSHLYSTLFDLIVTQQQQYVSQHSSTPKQQNNGEEIDPKYNIYFVLECLLTSNFTKLIQHTSPQTWKFTLSLLCTYPPLNEEKHMYIAQMYIQFKQLASKRKNAIVVDAFDDNLIHEALVILSILSGNCDDTVQYWQKQHSCDRGDQTKVVISKSTILHLLIAHHPTIQNINSILTPQDPTLAPITTTTALLPTTLLKHFLSTAEFMLIQCGVQTTTLYLNTIYSYTGALFDTPKLMAVMGNAELLANPTSEVNLVNNLQQNLSMFTHRVYVTSGQHVAEPFTIQKPLPTYNVKEKWAEILAQREQHKMAIAADALHHQQQQHQQQYPQVQHQPRPSSAKINPGHGDMNAVAPIAQYNNNNPTSAPPSSQQQPITPHMGAAQQHTPQPTSYQPQQQPQPYQQQSQPPQPHQPQATPLLYQPHTVSTSHVTSPTSAPVHQPRVTAPTATFQPTQEDLSICEFFHAMVHNLEEGSQKKLTSVRTAITSLDNAIKTNQVSPQLKGEVLQLVMALSQTDCQGAENIVNSMGFTLENLTYPMSSWLVAFTEIIKTMKQLLGQ